MWVFLELRVESFGAAGMDGIQATIFITQGSYLIKILMKPFCLSTNLLQSELLKYEIICGNGIGRALKERVSSVRTFGSANESTIAPFYIRGDILSKF